MNVDEHHLIPRSRKGTEKEKIHRVCHDKIHATFTDKELADYYHTWSRLTNHDSIRGFVKWIKNKAPEYLDTPIMSNRIRRKR